MRTDDKAIFDLDPNEQSPESRREIKEILLGGIRNIELQLGSKDRTDIAGNRLSASDYQKWRKNAIKSMNYKSALYRRYKALDKAATRNESTATEGSNHSTETSVGCSGDGEARA